MSKEEINKIAGVHLGKAGDGSAVKPYVTPDKHDKTLLVPIPRSIGRVAGNVDSNSFVGYEVWHAYEMSFLRQNGMPCTGVLKLSYPATSESMIESKSLKLYLNSFDLERFDDKKQVETIISTDLTEALGGEVKCFLHVAENQYPFARVFNLRFINVDDRDINITEYQENPKLLDVTNVNEITFHTANLRSNCEITNQKDTGNCFILMKGDITPSHEGLMKYVVSMRESQHFHENVTEIIFDTLMRMYQCDELLVANLYQRRGGIDIHSIRASSQEVMDSYVNNYDDVYQLFERTMQQ